jgi:hypothetical protein
MTPFNSFMLLFSLIFSVQAAPDASRFETMTPEEARLYEAQAAQTVADLALIPPVLNTSPLPEYDYDQLDYGMVIGSARTPGGRLWSCWVAGEDGPEAFFVLNCSDDNGETWSNPRLVIDAHSDRLPMPRSTLVGNLWTDPTGKLWLFFSQSMQSFDGRAGSWAVICENPDADSPQWSAPRRIWHGYTLNKPTVLSGGEWVLPVSLNQASGPAPFSTTGIFNVLDPLRGAHAFVSTDQGATWVDRGHVAFPDPSWHEHMFIERNDGSLWMLARTAKGMMQSFSDDGGRTWSTPSFPAGINQPVSRFHIRRLASGRLLFIKHGETIDTHSGRSLLSAWLSEDDGATWMGGLMLDERTGVSYPDGFQAPDGTIYITYDRNRATDGEILMARIREEDVLAGELVDPDSKLKMLVSRPMKNRTRDDLDSNASAAALLPFSSPEPVDSNGEIRTLGFGEVIHSDRSYTFNDIPAAFLGRSFVFSSISSAEFTCSRDGTVYVFAPTLERNPGDSCEPELLQQGFEKAAVTEFVLMLYNGEARALETCSVYQKAVEAGEQVELGRWGVLVF